MNNNHDRPDDILEHAKLWKKIEIAKESIGALYSEAELLANKYNKTDSVDLRQRIANQYVAIDLEISRYKTQIVTSEYLMSRLLDKTETAVGLSKEVELNSTSQIESKLTEPRFISHIASESKTRQCPFCLEQIPYEATACKHCTRPSFSPEKLKVVQSAQTTELLVTYGFMVVVAIVIIGVPYFWISSLFSKGGGSGSSSSYSSDPVVNLSNEYGVSTSEIRRMQQEGNSLDVIQEGLYLNEQLEARE
jgi:hypothetical protein